MPKTLINLIKASGNTGVAGQSFLNHVTGASSGAKMTDYNLSRGSVSGIPADPSVTTYTGPQTFNISWTMTRGSRGHNIQINTISAWEIKQLLHRNTSGSLLDIGTGTAYDFRVAGGRARIQNFSTSGSPTGATHNFDVLFDPCKNGTASVSGTATKAVDAAPNIVFSCTTSVSSSGGGGQHDLYLRLQTTFDIGQFNDKEPLDSIANNPTSIETTNDIKIRFNYASWVKADLEFEWYPTETDRTNGTNVLNTNSDPTFFASTAPNTWYTVWMRWRTSGGSWNNKRYRIFRNSNGTWQNTGEVADL